MKHKIGSLLLAGIASVMFSLATAEPVSAAERIVFTGGPAGGTFQVVANAIQVYDPVKELKDIKVKAQSSAGSVENLRKVNEGRAQMGVAYSGHVYLGRNGRLKNDDRKYEDVLAVSYLYGAPAQLVVRADSGIKSTKDLIGKKVGVGNAGSGAFANCELFFNPPVVGSDDFFLLFLKQKGCTDIRFTCLVAAPEGIERFQADHPDVPITTSAIDRQLNDKGYIVPGLGDAGDRIYGTVE